MKGTFKGWVLFYLLRINEFGDSLTFFKVGSFNFYILWNVFFGNRHPDHLFYLLQMILLGSIYKRNCHSCVVCSSRSANSMDIIFIYDRNFKINNMAYLRYINSSGGYICGNQ